ncbi:hypothetical protein MCW82_07025 [Azospirillum doebereinerae]|uniref:hypothetical protein n=1 Tax=Azospirillum doebereinerae TaxID=92933 RepID=UPI001EE58AB7|nr:hypothetical protein [Azospirillum doebereinerae]MCG5239519.1 hypothetical protein [Azospirillum doebereinerae]
MSAKTEELRLINGDEYDEEDNPDGLDGGMDPNFVRALRLVADVADEVAGAGERATQGAASAVSAANAAAHILADANAANDIFIGLLDEAQDAAEAAQAAAASVNLPAITAANAGQSLEAKPDGTGWQLATYLKALGGTLTGWLRTVAGSAASPGLQVGEAGTGLYLASAGVVALVLTGAVEVFRTAATGVLTVYKAVRGVPVPVPYGSTVTLDFSAGNDFVISTLTGNLTLANPINVAVGQGGTIYTAEDGTGGRTISLAGNWKKMGPLSPTMTANKVNAIVYSVPKSSSEILYSIAPQP